MDRARCPAERRQLPRLAARGAVGRPARSTDDASACGCRAARRGHRRGHQYLELIAGQGAYTSPARPRASSFAATSVDGAVLVTKESQHVSWHRVARSRATTPSRCRSTTTTSATSTSTSRSSKDDRLYRAERRLRGAAPSRRSSQVTVTPTSRVAARASPRRSPCKVDRRRGRAGARAAEPRRRRRGASTACRPDTTPDPLRFFYRREYSRVSTAFSREYSFVGYSGTRAAAARAAAPAADARRLQGRSARASRRCARTSPTRSSGRPTSSTDAAGRRARSNVHLPRLAHHVAAHGARGHGRHAGRRARSRARRRPRI